MKRLLLVLFFSTLGYSQSDSEITIWVNNFENNNPVEKLLIGEYYDRINIGVESGFLLVNSMDFNGYGKTPARNRQLVTLSEIERIEAVKKVRADGDVIVTFRICTSRTGFIRQKFKNNSVWINETNTDEFVKKFGACSSQLSFKFPGSIVDRQIERVYKALKTLANNHGANPKIGSLF